MTKSPFHEQPGYGEVARKFQEEGRQAAQAAMERRDAGVKRYKELLRRKKEFEQNIDEVIKEMETLVDKWGIEPSEGDPTLV